MAFQIASLFAKIGADTTDLNRGLRDADAQLDKTAGEMRKLDGAAGDAASGTGKLDAEVKTFNASLGVYLGLVGSIAAATKAAFDFSEQGAAITQTARSFDRLGLSIEEMRAASRGTIDDMTLMSATLTLTAGASEDLEARLLQSAPQLMEIAKAANAVNPALGDTAHMYDSIATGIKRASPMILDNLGIIVKVGDANERYAEQIGKAVEELSAEEKQIALLNETMRAGNRLIEQAGGSTAAYGDGWAQVRVEIKNATDALKENAAVIGGPIVNRYADFLRYSRESEESLIGFGAALRAASMMLWANEDVTNALSFAWKNVTGQWSAAADMLINVGEAAEYASKGTRALGDAAKGATGKQAAYNAELEHELAILGAMASIPETTITSSIGSGMGRLAGGLKNVAELVGNSADAWDQYNEAIARTDATAQAYANQRYEQIRAAQREERATLLVAAVNSDLGETLEDNRQQYRDLGRERADMLVQLRDLQGEHGRYVTVQREAALTGHDLAIAQHQLASAQERMAEADVGSEAWHRAAKQAENLQAKINDVGGSITSMVDKSDEIADLESNIAGATEEMQALLEASRGAVASLAFSQLYERAISDEVITEAEAALLEVAGAAAGIDTAFVGVYNRVKAAAEAVDGVGESTEEANRNAENLGRTWDGWINTTAAGIENFSTTVREPFQRAALLTRELGTAADETKPQLEDFGAVGGSAGDAIASGLGAARAALQGVPGDVAAAQGAIDGMRGKEITISIGFQVGSVPSLPRGVNQRDLLPDIEPELDGGLAAGGFAPVGTNWLVGEGGPELMSVGATGTQITPIPGMGGDGASLGGSTWTGDLIVHGTGNPEATAALVMRKLQDRGLVQGVATR